MHRITTLIVLVAVAALATCTINIDDMESLYEDTAGSRVGRLMMDSERGRLILVEKNAIRFIDINSKAITPIALNHYTSLDAGFLNDQGQFFVFGSNGTTPGYTLISIDGSGKFTEKALVNLNSLGCALYMKDTHVLLTTRQSGIPTIAAYDYLHDNITGGFSLIEDFSDNDCIRSKDTGLFTTTHHMISVDMSKAFLPHIDTKLADAASGFNRIALDPTYGKAYVTYSQYADVIQYDIESRKLASFKGDASQFAGYLGMATHPSDSSIYLFTTALLKSTAPTAAVVQTDRNLQLSNSFNIPNGAFFSGRGHFNTKTKRMYVLGYRTLNGNLNIFSIGLDSRFHMSTAAIIGISVGGGVGLIALIGLIAGCIFFSRRSKRPSYEEKSRLINPPQYMSTA